MWISQKHTLHELDKKLKSALINLKVLQNLSIIKHSVKNMCMGVEVWLHQVLNLGTIWGSNTDCGLDSLVMQH